MSDTGASRAVKVVGRYALHGEIASGGMARVVIGRFVAPAGFSRTVAIKQLYPHFAKDPEVAAMFQDEARLAARIRHPNVVPVLDVVAEKDEILLVMEYVPGTSLARAIQLAAKRSERVPPTVAAAILTGVLNGLHAAHEACDEENRPLGVVHRDVSPQNVIVGTDGIARVLDFGVAKAFGRSQVTRDGQLKGKMAYMAPEQLRGQQADRRTDIYSASVVLWETLTGRPLFSAENDVAVFGKVIAGAKTPPGEYVPLLPRAFDEVTMRGLSVSPDDRFPTAREMAQALARQVTVATPADVSDWLASLAGDELAARASRVAAVESGSAPALPPPRSEDMHTAISTSYDVPSGPALLATPVPPAPGQPAAFGPSGTALLPGPVPGAPSDPDAGRPTWLWIAFGGGIGLAAVIIALWIVARARERADLAISTPTVPAPSATAVVPPASAASVATEASSPVETPAASGSVEEIDPASPSESAPHPAVHAPVHPAVHPVRHPPKNQCDPPYYFDSSGTKRYKRECY